jgi:hypothetical protein
MLFVMGKREKIHTHPNTVVSNHFDGLIGIELPGITKYYGTINPRRKIQVIFKILTW